MKSWRERYNKMKIVAKSKGVPMVCKIEGKETLYVPGPEQVEKVVRTVPKGRLMTIQTICEKLARDYKTTKGCSMTVGQIMMLISNVNEEEKGKLPWWRIIKSDGELHPKYPRSQKLLLEKEGYKIVKKGNKSFVKDYEKKLLKIE